MEVPVEERCRAKLKWVANWRCTRRATGNGLCAQHRQHGAVIPTDWEHERNKYGVLMCKPVPPFMRIAGDG
jgi:hypothetical protein